MNRRAFITGLGAVLAAPVAVEAQQPGKLRRIGVAVPVEPSDDQDVAAFRQALRDLGYVDAHGAIDLPL